jgi:hypothetical protein
MGMMFNNYRQWVFVLFFCGMSANVAAQDFIGQPMQMQGYAPQDAYSMGHEKAPSPPPGPYQVDPDPKSANIYYDMRETESYHQQPEPYSGYVAPQYPAGQIAPSPYRQGYYPSPALGGYYQPGREAYGHTYPPTYPGYSPYSQPQYVNPYGQQR